MSRATFRVFWRFDGTREGTVTIDRGAGTFTVRPYRRHVEYTLPLADVAQFVAERISKADAQKKRAERFASRRRV